MNDLEVRLRDALTARARQIPYDTNTAWLRRTAVPERRRIPNAWFAAAAVAVVLVAAAATTWAVLGRQTAIPAAPVPLDESVPVSPALLEHTGVGGQLSSKVVVTGHVTIDGVPSDLIAWLISGSSTESYGGQVTHAAVTYLCTGTVPSATLTPLSNWNCFDPTGIKPRTSAGFQATAVWQFDASHPGDMAFLGIANDKVASVSIEFGNDTSLPATLFGRSSGFPFTVYQVMLKSPVPSPRADGRYTLIARDVTGHVLGREDQFPG